MTFREFIQLSELGMLSPMSKLGAGGAPNALPTLPQAVRAPEDKTGDQMKKMKQKLIPASPMGGPRIGKPAAPPQPNKSAGVYSARYSYTPQTSQRQPGLSGAGKFQPPGPSPFASGAPGQGGPWVGKKPSSGQTSA